MKLALNQDETGTYWSYNAEQLRVEFTVGKEHMFPRTQEGFDKFTLPIIPLGLHPDLTTIFDFGLFQERYCSIPPYPAKAWETSYQEISREGKFGVESDQLAEEFKKFFVTL